MQARGPRRLQPRSRLPPATAGGGAGGRDRQLGVPARPLRPGCAGGGSHRGARLRGRGQRDAAKVPGRPVSVFLTELAKKTAERWLALLVLPGILWVTALFVAWRLGQWPPLEGGRLRSWLSAQAGNPSSHSLATVLLAAVGLLAAAAGAGLVASALGAGVQRLWAA